MQRSKWWGVLIGFCVSLSGCGANNETSGEASINTSDLQSPATVQSGQSPPIEGKTSDPAQTVENFLAAVKAADDQTAERLLTTLAREKTAELDIVVAPPGSETASFEVGQVEYLSKTEAHVSSIWIDLDLDGQSQSDKIVWALRRSADGWRIAGMATQVFEDQPMLFLNFEDPADMLRKQQLVEEEIQRRIGGQPTLPASPGSDASLIPPRAAGQPRQIDRNDRTAGSLPPRQSGSPPQRPRENTSSRSKAAPPRRYDR